MSNEPTQPATEGVEPTIADAVTDPTMVPFDDDAGGPTADKPNADAPSDEELATKLGDFA